MLQAKLWYFCYFSALSWLFPYLNLLCRRWGLSASQIGTIGCLRPLISFPSGSLLSGVADKTRAHRPVLLAAFAASLLLRLSIAAAGPRGYWPLLAVVVLMEACAAPVCIIVDAAVNAACQQPGEYGKQRLWGAVGWGFFAAVSGECIHRAGIWAAFAGHAALAAAAMAPTLRLPFGPLHARLAERASQPAGGSSLEQGKQQQGWEEDEEERQQRRHHAAGPVPTDGSRRSVPREDSAQEAQSLLHGSPAFGNSEPPEGSGRGAGSDGGGPAAKQEQQAQQQAQQAQQQQVHVWQGLRELLGRPEAAIFLAQALFMGFGVGNIEGFLFLYLDELGGSELLMGLSLSVTCAAETLVFYFLPQILRCGIRRCMHAVMLAFLVRMGWYAALKHMPSPWLVMPAEVLHGFTFALAWGGGCAYCSQLAPPGLEATTLSLFSGLYFGVGVACGALVGGQVYHRLGAQAVYIVACGVLAAGWVVTSAAELAVRVQHDRRAAAVKRSSSGLPVRYLQLTTAEINERAQLG